MQELSSLMNRYIVALQATSTAELTPLCHKWVHFLSSISLTDQVKVTPGWRVTVTLKSTLSPTTSMEGRLKRRRKSRLHKIACTMAKLQVWNGHVEETSAPSPLGTRWKTPGRFNNDRLDTAEVASSQHIPRHLFRAAYDRIGCVDNAS